MSEIDLLIEELEDVENNPIKPFVAIRIVWYLCKYKYHEYRIAELESELKITDELLKEATETIGAVVACCTYNSNDDAKIGIYGIDQKAFTRIDQFITHYNDAVSAGKVSVDVKRGLEE